MNSYEIIHLLMIDSWWISVELDIICLSTRLSASLEVMTASILFP